MKETNSIFQEECPKQLDNQPGKPGNQVKIKRKGVNPCGDIVTSNKTFENILKKFDEKKQTEAKCRSRIRNH